MDKLNNFIENLKQNSPKDIDFSLLFDWEYLTDPNPTSIFIYEQWIYVVVLVNIIISVLCFKLVADRFIREKPKYRFVRKVSFLWFVNTLLLLLYNLMRAEGIRLLSMRILLVVIIILYLIILIYFLIYWILFLPKQMEKFNNARIRNKYNQVKKK